MKDEFAFHRSTPRGEGGIAVFELHGQSSRQALTRIFRARSGHLPEAAQARLGDFLDLAGELIDEGLVTNVPPESAWSRLATWALSLHGGPWIQEKAAEVLRALGGVELDLRGVLSRSVTEGGLDCIQAAAYEHLIAARTEKAASFFARQHAGELSGLIREGLEALERGQLEASESLARRLLLHSHEAMRLAEPLRLLIAGPPNAGKSTLFNRLVEEERAVVSSIPGTTRDSLEETVALDDFPIVVSDSPGLRDPAKASEIERLGIERALERSDDAVLYLIPFPWIISTEDRAFIRRWKAESVVVVASQADLSSGEPSPGLELRFSARTGEGLERLKRAIVERWISSGRAPQDDVPVAAFSPRLRSALERARPASEESSIGRGAALDEHRKAYLECRDFSWP